MDPDLSRRVARIMGLLAIPWGERAAFVARVERARGFADLPEADRQAILEAEKAAARGLDPTIRGRWEGPEAEG